MIFCHGFNSQQKLESHGHTGFDLKTFWYSDMIQRNIKQWPASQFSELIKANKICFFHFCSLDARLGLQPWHVPEGNSGSKDMAKEWRDEMWMQPVMLCGLLFFFKCDSDTPQVLCMAIAKSPRLLSKCWNPGWRCASCVQTGYLRSEGNARRSRQCVVSKYGEISRIVGVCHKHTIYQFVGKPRNPSANSLYP